MIDLKNRQILSDGTVLCSDKALLEILYSGQSLDTAISKPSDDIDLYNRTDRYLDTNYGALTSASDEIYKDVNWFTYWVTPEPYSKIDVETEILNRCTSEEEFFRAKTELKLFNERHMYPVLQHLLYLVDHWRSNGILWGVGRGSSVSSLVLYLIGINRINPLDFDLDIEEFLK